VKIGNMFRGYLIRKIRNEHRIVNELYVE